MKSGPLYKHVIMFSYLQEDININMYRVTQEESEFCNTNMHG